MLGSFARISKKGPFYRSWPDLAYICVFHWEGVLVLQITERNVWEFNSQIRFARLFRSSFDVR